MIAGAAYLGGVATKSRSLHNGIAHESELLNDRL